MIGKAILLNKQVWLAVGAITFAGAVVVTGTGAFFSDTADVSANTFAVGTLDLKLTQNEDGGSPADTQSALWDFTNMAPGGTPETASVWLRNTGSVDGSTVGVGIANGWTNPSNIAAQMRITEMTLDGNNLLEGGAGHNFGLYEAPTNCDVEVNYGANNYTRISEAVDAATAGQVICVGAGNYSQAWETAGNGTGFPIQIDVDDVTLASVDGPSATTIGGGVDIKNPEITLTGFTIDGESTANGATFGVYVGTGADNVEISFNELDGSDTAESRGVVTATGAVTGLHAHNNYSHNWASGMYLNDSSSMLVEHNTLSENVVGISNDHPNSNTLQLNQIVDNSFEGVGVLNDSGDSITIEKNNIYSNGTDVAEYGTEALDAENNWWGDFDPSDQVSGDVDYEPFAGGPFAGLVNGNDANGNGFADLRDLRDDSITGITPGLDAYDGSNDKEFVMSVQLDGPTTGNNFQGLVLDDVEIEFTLNQI